MQFPALHVAVGLEEIATVGAGTIKQSARAKVEIALIVRFTRLD
jgi:hypothetical protein